DSHVTLTFSRRTSPRWMCAAIAADLNARGIPTATGVGEWQAPQVRRVLARLGDPARLGAPPPGGMLHECFRLIVHSASTAPALAFASRLGPRLRIQRRKRSR